MGKTATVLACSVPTNPCDGAFKCFNDGHGHIEYTTLTNTIFLHEFCQECTLRDATTMSMPTWLDLPTFSRPIQSWSMHIKVGNEFLWYMQTFFPQHYHSKLHKNAIGIVNGYMHNLCTLRTIPITTSKQKSAHDHFCHGIF